MSKRDMTRIAIVAGAAALIVWYMQKREAEAKAKAETKTIADAMGFATGGAIDISGMMGLKT